MKYVYLVSAYHMIPCGYLKVGITGNYKARKTQIQTHSPFKIMLISVVTHSEPYELEQMVLDNFRQHRIRGEWFSTWGPLETEHAYTLEKEIADFMKNNCDGEVIK